MEKIEVCTQSANWANAEQWLLINVLIMILSFFSHLKRTSELDK